MTSLNYRKKAGIILFLLLSGILLISVTSVCAFGQWDCLLRSFIHPAETITGDTVTIAQAGGNSQTMRNMAKASCEDKIATEKAAFTLRCVQDICEGKISNENNKICKATVHFKPTHCQLHCNQQNTECYADATFDPTCMCKLYEKPNDDTEPR